MIFYILSALLALSGTAAAGPLDALPPALSTSTVIPTYVTLAPTVHDYSRFADGGPDANWYVGFNNAWIVKLPPAPLGDFSRAFIGARLGRAKTQSDPDKPWVRQIIPGKVYIGISQTPSWTSEQSFFLAETKDIPAEPDPQTHVDGVGAAHWFWAEVPTALISFTAPNYVAVWSPTEDFVSASSAPIIAGADVDSSSDEPLAWNNRSISGVPPRNPDSSLETPISNIVPALAIELVPPGPEEPAVAVSDLDVARSGKRLLVRFSASGVDVGDAWIESSRDSLDWSRLSARQQRPPYVFDLSPDKIPPSGQYLRGAARDISGAVGYSKPFMLPYAPPILQPNP
ncbi:MAG: hypothetical protein KGM24_11100 [Elusimicrobia bacterium]|nr:hypothetical protein [Elusimicrobiota bacterium]